MSRPTGRGQYLWGWWLLIISGVLLFVNIGDATSNPDRFTIYLILFSACAGISVVLFACGAIIRAISYLPGRDIDEPEADQ